jgi:ankyrin repeat protein
MTFFDTQEGRTPLMLAATLGQLDFMICFLRCGADPNVEDNEKTTALHWAAREGHANACLILLDQVSLLPITISYLKINYVIYLLKRAV